MVIDLSWKLLALPALAAAAGFAAFFPGHERSDFDRRLPLASGGTVSADIALGGGFSFDHGSLEIRSHDASDVRVEADSRGWGKYAVDLELSEGSNRVDLVGRVEGTLHWLFGGPAVDVRIWVPRDVTIEARIDGGPLLMEDLAGPITAHVGDTNVSLRRAAGMLALHSRSGAVEVEDIEGELSVETESGSVEVSALQGSLRVAADSGSVDIESVTGPVQVDAQRGRVEIEEVRGEVRITTERGSIDAEEVQGNLIARTEHGRIDLESIEGVIQAHSGRGNVEVEFETIPQGEITTERGNILVEVPEEAAYQLDARTEHGRIRVGDDADEWGNREWGDRDSGDRDEGREGRRGWKDRQRDSELTRDVNGGGPLLRLRSGRGTIRIQD